MIRTWNTEHPTSYDAAVEATLVAAGFSDDSWHNDMCASFVRGVDMPLARGEVKIFIDHVLPADREDSAAKRFTVTRYYANSDTCAEDQTFDTLPKALRCALRLCTTEAEGTVLNADYVASMITR